MKKNHTVLKVESLERRELMAGDVRVTASGSDLFITGDNAANHVQLIATNPGELKIRGVTLYNGATLLNGANRDLVYRGIPRNIYVSMGGGDDQVDLGTGNQVAIQATNDVWVDMGAGSDWVAARDLKVGHDLIVNTGTGTKDVANISNVAAVNEIVVGDPLRVAISGLDRNDVTINNSSARRITVDFNNGQDNVNIVASAADSIYASLGGGNDSFSMTFTKVKKSYWFDGGAGSDSFFAPMYQGTKFSSQGFERVNNA